MPITCPISILPMEQDEFARLDYQVMSHAFKSHDELGQLCDEVIYKNDLAARLELSRLGPALVEVPITVTHGSFRKTYFMDLLVANRAVYELKATVQLAGEHEAQLLNYLMMIEATHGKLVNFRTAKVESKFVNGRMSRKSQKEFEVCTKSWREEDETSQFLRRIVVELCEDWGCSLELPLYVEALTHFLGGEEKVLGSVELRRGSLLLGNQFMHLLNPSMAFRLTALSGSAERYQE